MSDMNGEFPTVLGPDARFKGELSFEKGLRILGQFEGHIKSKGTLHIAEGARVVAHVEATNVKVDGEIRGNVVCSEKLHLSSSARIEGDLRTTRLEMNDGAQFIGNVAVGQTALEQPVRREPPGSPAGMMRPADAAAQPVPRPRPPVEQNAGMPAAVAPVGMR